MAMEWTSSLSATERMQAKQLGMSEAIAIEQKLYQASTSKDEYISSCEAAAAVAPTVPGDDAFSPSTDNDQEDTGISIGTYRNCSYVSEGITSEVYRSGATALKVIVAHAANIEPHNPHREARILQSLRGRPSIIELSDVFRDQEQRLVLAFPYMPLTLAQLLEKSQTALPAQQIRTIAADVLRGLEDIHAQGIVHRDIKPSAILLPSPSGPAVLSDFGTAWHPEFSASSEPKDAKILDIGTGPYRAPEVLFGDRSYGPPVDMWAFGVVLSEAISSPPAPVFESRPAHEDGSQLGLILSIFKTLGTPTPETWPEAADFKVSPFQLWTVFPRRSWEEILPDVDPLFRELVGALLRYDGARATAQQVSASYQKQAVTQSSTKFGEQALRFDCLS